MEKLKKYNQWLLAILGTQAVAALVFVLLFSGYLLVEEIFFSPSRVQNDSPSITVTDSTTTPDKPNVRQAITFHAPTLLDTGRAIYLIPVSLAGTNEDADEYAITDKLGRSSRHRKSFQYQGAYSNIIVYHQKANTKIPVFSTRINILDFSNDTWNEQPYLFIRGTKHDTNKDHQLNADDLQSFFLYDIEKNVLKEIRFPNVGLIDYEVLYGTDQLVLRFGQDRDSNGTIDNEPILLKRYRIGENGAEDLIDAATLQRLEGLVN